MNFKSIYFFLSIKKINISIKIINFFRKNQERIVFQIFFPFSAFWSNPFCGVPQSMVEKPLVSELLTALPQQKGIQVVYIKWMDIKENANGLGCFRKQPLYHGRKKVVKKIILAFL
jgi:hypothetical protein